MAENMVLGFAFSSDRKSVILVEKNRPEWQAGKINGVGGHVNEGETDKAAMIREFKEETGHEGPFWDEFLIMTGRTWVVHCFCTLFPDVGSLKFPVEFPVKDAADEIKAVRIYSVAALPDNVLYNLRWIIPLALDFDTCGISLVTYQ